MIFRGAAATTVSLERQNAALPTLFSPALCRMQREHPPCVSQPWLVLCQFRGAALVYHTPVLLGSAEVACTLCSVMHCSTPGFEPLYSSAH